MNVLRTMYRKVLPQSNEDCYTKNAKNLPQKNNHHKKVIKKGSRIELRSNKRIKTADTKSRTFVKKTFVL